MIIHPENETEFNEAMKNDKVVIDFFATWCGPCMRLSPLIEEVAESHPEITFVKVDCDKLGKVAAHYNVYSIPDLRYIENGKEVRSQVGYMPLPLLKKFIGGE